MLALAFALNFAVAAAAAEHHLFGSGKDWLIIDSSGAVVRRLELAHPQLPEGVQDATLSRDGKMVLIAASSPEAGNVMLYLWDLVGDVVTQVGERRGFHAAPSFSADGKWITFAHHATRGGPVGMHEARAYAQLYRQRLEGGAPEALTSSDGCHMESWSKAAEDIYFAHSNCHGGLRLERWTRGTATAITDFDGHLGQPSLSADGLVLVAAKARGDELEIVEVTLKEPSRPRSLWRGTRVGERFRPAFLGTTRDVVFQNGSSVLILRRTKSNGVGVEVVKQ